MYWRHSHRGFASTPSHWGINRTSRLLQQIATDTGGTFHLSPTSFDLYGIYNQIRVDSSDDDLVLNEVVHSQGDDHEDGSSFWVEDGAARLLISLSWPNASKAPALSLYDPYGRRLRRGDWGYEAVLRPTHLTLRVLRPVPGRWRISVRGQGRSVVAAFVRSPLAGPLHAGGDPGGQAPRGGAPVYRCGHGLPEALRCAAPGFSRRRPHGHTRKLPSALSGSMRGGDKCAPAVTESSPRSWRMRYEPREP